MSDWLEEIPGVKRIVISEDFKINGKTCVVKGNDWEEKVSERSNGGHEMNMGICFQYYNPVILDYIASQDLNNMKKNNLKIVKIDKSKSLFNYEKKILINELILDLKLGYYDFEKEKPQKVKFSLEIDYQDKKPSNDKDIKSIVNYSTIVKLITKLVKKKHYNFLETLAESVFDELFKDKRIAKIMLKIEKLEILKQCSSVGIQITKKRSHDKF